MNKNWTPCKIMDLIAKGEAELKTGPFGTQLHASDYVETGTPVINVRNVGFGSIREDNLEFISEETVQRLKSHLLEAEDIVFGRKGAVERHAFIEQKHVRWFQGSDCLRLRIKSSRIVPRFLSYYFQTEAHKQWMIKQCSHGSTMASLNQDIISRISFPLPSLPIQHKIASVLSAYDDLIENNTRRIAILEEVAQTIYQEWFVHFRYPGHEKNKMVESELGMIPEGWEITEIGQIATVYRGRSYGHTNLVEEGGLPFLNLKCIERDGGFRHDGIKQYQGPYKESNTAQAGDIIMAVTDVTQERRLIARAARVPKNEQFIAVFSMDLVKIVPNDERYREYLYSMLRFSNFSAEVKQHANGANVLHLAPARIENFVFPFPAVSLCILFSKISKNIYEASDILQLKNANLRRTRDLLLPKLISGEIDVETLDIDISDIPEPEAQQQNTAPIMQPEPIDASQLAFLF